MLPTLYSSRQPTYSRAVTPPGGTHTPASAFTREQRMLARYRELLYALTTDTEALMRAIWGPDLTPLQMYGKEGNEGRIDRLDHSVPDLLKQLRPEEQQPIDDLLRAGDLVGTVHALLGQERTLTTRETACTAPDDTRHARAAGLGYLSSVSYGRRHANSPCHVAAPAPATLLEAPARGCAPAMAQRPLPPCQLRPKQRKLYAEVKKAQERKRLKRKRRR